MIEKTINFDMDGTIADLYGVQGWLDSIINKSAEPYRVAEPMVRFSSLARILNNMQKNGWKICIISWLAKNSTTDYDEMVTRAKIEWLNKHLPSVRFDEINIVKYGTPKHTIGRGYLFDDELNNRTNWGEGAFDEKDIIETLKKLRGGF